MTIPTEPIGSIPRPLKLLEAINRHGGSHPSLEPLYDEAIRDTIEQFEATGSPVITDGEQRKYHNFATYCVESLPNTGWIQTVFFGWTHSPVAAADRWVVSLSDVWLRLS